MPEHDTPSIDGAEGFIERTYGRADGDGLDKHPPTAPHLLIRASAGTGKTYRLTTRYLRLLHAGETPEHILATTFTRKAAGEVLGRVLGWLARASVDPNERSALDDALGGFGLTEQECLAMLRRLVDGLHRLSIGTIDSFFNRAARALRFELDLPAEPRLADEGGPLAKALRTDAIQQVLGDAAATDDGFQTLIELLRRVHHDTARRSVTEAIDDLAAGLHDVYRLYPDAKLWSTLDPPSTLSADLLRGVVDQVVALGDAVPLTKAGKPRASWTKAYQALSAAAQRHDFDAVLAHALCQRLIDDEQEDMYAGCDIPDAWRDALMPLLSHARALAAQRLAHMTEATHRLLAEFSGHYEQAKRKAGVLMFSDLTHLLASYLPGRGADATAEFYYRLDARVTHLLLDEFQDTSLPQWQVLSPFAEEVTAAADGERSFFCVGDEKQAIYGWRGGCAELFSAVEALPGVTPWTMTRSRRSSQVVLDAVNRVFSTLPDNVALQDKTRGGRWDAAVGQWAERFETHSAHDAEMSGYVRLQTTAPSQDGADDDIDHGGETADTPAGVSAHDAYCAEYIAALARRSPGRSIGVLVRRKAALRGLLLRLRAMGVAVSEEGGNPIDHTPAVSAVLSAVQLADHPGDSAAAFHVANSPMAAVLGLDPARGPGANAEAIASRIRRALLDRGFGETIAGWCKALTPSCDARSLRRVEQLVVLAQRYDQDVAADPSGQAALRPGGFVDVVRQARVESPTPATVRVMTLHAAKGLEFDTVVLPDLAGLLSQNDHKAQVLLDRESPIDPPRAILRRIDRNTLASLGLEQIADREDALRRGEDLCLLYVGMTRAKHALHMLVPPLKQTSKGLSSVGRTNLSYAAVLRQALAAEADESPDGDAVLYEHGDSGWAGETTASVPATAETMQAPARAAIRLATGAGPRRSRPERRPSDGAEESTVRAADLLRRTPAGGRSFGSAMHAVCEWLGFVDEDPLPGGDAVADALRCSRYPVTQEEAERFVARVAAMVSAPDVHESLSRDGAAELWRERPFVAVDGDRMLQGVFDRVHVWRDETGRATRARLIDFKTDKLPDADAGGADALVEHYRPQLAAYRDALMAMLKLDPGAVEAMLILTGEAVVLPVAL